MSKHTPGPWSINNWPQRDSSIAIGAIGTPLIARVKLRDVSINEQNANARLIAAAPESHASNVELAEIVREMCRALRIPEPVEALARSDAAIAKAKGEV